MGPRSPAERNTARLLGYIAGGMLPADDPQFGATFALICTVHRPEAVRDLPYTQGYIAGMVARWCGVSLMPLPDAVSRRPWSGR